MILFSILVVIQFVVITQGATRISEVAARFTLDGLPGRQMAIDADLHAGLIDQHEAHRRRDEVYRQADFFGAMDGASRFVRGDAIAGVVILLVNIGGGLFLGMVNHGMSLGEAVNVFTKLTIGDGLVSQVPAFLISLAAGLIVTRSSSSTDLSRDVVGQLFSQPGVLGTAAVFLGLMALTPLPKLPLLTLGGALGAGRISGGLAARRRSRVRRAVAAGDRECRRGRARASGRPERRGQSPGPRPGQDRRRAATGRDGSSADAGSERMEDLLHVDPLELEIGFRLIGLADPSRGGDLLDRLKAVRQRVAREMGLIVPQVRIHDEIGLPPNEYRVKIRGTHGGAGDRLCRAGCWPCRRPGWSLAPTAATASTRSPASRPSGSTPTAARSPSWPAAASSKPRRSSPATSARSSPSHADELLTREQVERLLDRVRSIGADPGRRGRARAAPRRRAAARLAEPAPRAGQHPRSGDDPGDAGRARRQDQGHRSLDRAGAPEPGAADHRELTAGPTAGSAS